MAEFGPHLLPGEGADAGEDLDEPFEVGAIDRFGFVDVVYEHHHRGDGGVEGKGSEILRDFLDHLGVGSVELVGILIG